MDVNSRDPSQNIIPFRIKGVDVARFDSAGNLGIGTTTPTTKLDVAGAVQIVGSLNIINTNTDSNQSGITLNGVAFQSNTNSAVVVNIDSQPAQTTALNRQKKQSIPLSAASTLATSDIVAKMSGVSVGKSQTYGVGPAQMASYGNIVVAVGEGTNCIAYSLVNPPTASSWIGIPNSSNTFTSLSYNIAYANGTWVAVGGGTNNIAYSTSTPPVASSWVGVPSGTFNGVTNIPAPCRNIAYGNGVWVAVGGGPPSIAYSLANPPTAESWVGIPYSPIDNVYGITFGNGIWVVSGYGGLSYSTQTPPTANSWVSIPHNTLNDADRYIASTELIRRVIYANGVWLAAGSGTNPLLYSVENPPIAGSWMPITTSVLFGTATRSIAYGNGIWVACGDSGTLFAYSTSRIPHSSSWVAMKGPTPSSSGELIWNITFNAATNTWYFMNDIGTNCMFYSTATPPVPATWVGIQRSAGAFTTQALGAIGITTPAFTSPVNVARLDNKVTFPANRMLAVGGGSDVLARSALTPSPAISSTISYSDDDGATWQMVPGGATNSMFSSTADIAANTSFGVGGSRGANAVAWNGEKWVAAGNGCTHSLAFSDDGGMTWSGVTGKSIFSVEARDVAWNGQMWVAVGRGAAFSTAYSYDGVTWMGPVDASGTPINVFSLDIAGPTAATSDISGGGNHVIWTGKMWVATGTRTLITGSSPAAYYTIAYSTDGKTWTGVPDSGTVSTGFDIYAHGVAWNGRNYIATGRGTQNTLVYFTDVSGATTGAVTASWQGLGNSVFSVWGRGITWGAKRWMATGRGTNTVAYSINGQNWQGCGANVFKPLRRFMAMGDTPLYTSVSSGQPQRGVAFSYSDDGITWDAPVVNQAVEVSRAGGIPGTTYMPNAFYIRTGGSNWREFIPLFTANTTTNIQTWGVDQQFHDITYATINEIAMQFSYFAGYWLNYNRAKNGQSFSVNVYALSLVQPSIFTFTATSNFPVTTYNGILSSLNPITASILTPQTDGINEGIANSPRICQSIYTNQFILTNAVCDNVTQHAALMLSSDGGSSWARVPGTSDISNNGGTDMTVANNGVCSISMNPARTRLLLGGGDTASATRKVHFSNDGFNWRNSISSPNSTQMAWVFASLWIGGSYNRWLIGGSDATTNANGRIMRSGDADAVTAWVPTSPATYTGTNISCFAANTDFSIILAGAASGNVIYRSINGGESWTQVLNEASSISNIVASYNFDSNANDSSPNNNTLTDVSNVTYNTNDYKRGSASASFNGSNYFQISNDGRFSPDNFTISCWIKPIDSLGSVQTIASCRNSVNLTGWILYISQTNMLQFWTGIGSGSTWNGSTESLFPMSINVWTHISITLNKTTSAFVLYINGNVIQTTGTRIYVNNNGTNLRIGAGTNETIGSLILKNGTLIDDFRFYNKVLTQAEINVIYGYRSLRSISFSPSLGRWVAVGSSLLIGSAIIYSTDASGTTWNASPAQANTASTAIFKNNSEATRVIWDAVGSRFIIGGWNGGSVATLTNVAGLDGINNNPGYTMAYSADGINWTPATVRSSDNTSPSTFGPFLTRCSDLMALDTVGDFTPVNTGYSVSWNSYANRFVATGNGTCPVVYSNDGGVTWTPANQQPPQQAIAVAGGVSAAASTTSVSPLTYTIDGKTWFQGSGAKEIFGTGAVNSVEYGQTSTAISPINGRIWVAGGTHTSGTSCIAFSQNGIRWTAITNGSTMMTNVRTIVYAPAEQITGSNNAAITATSGVGNGVWVAGGDTTNSLIFSYDGISWSEVPNSLTILSRCNAIAFGNGLFVAGGVASSSGSTAVDATANMFYSTDGIAWWPIRNSVSRISAGASISSIAYGRDENGRGIWVAGASGSTTVSVIYSYNGVDWAGVSNTISTLGVTSIAYGLSASTGRGLWIAGVNRMTADGNAFVFSSTGRDGWTAIPNTKTGLFDVSGGGPTSISYFNGVWYATGSSAGISTGRTLAYSYDGSGGWFGVYPTTNMYGTSLTTFSLTDMRCVATTNDYILPSGASAGSAGSSGTAAASFRPAGLTTVRSIGWTAGVGSAYLQHPTILVGGESGRTTTAISGDGGRTWGSSTTSLAKSAFRGGVCNDLFWNGSIWAAVGHDTVSGAKLATSKDGVSWSQIAGTSIPINGMLNTIAWNGTMWMIGGDGSPTHDANTASFAWSSNLTSWNAITNTDISLTVVKRIAWNGMYWVAVGQGGSGANATTIMYSNNRNGLVWEDTFTATSSTTKTSAITTVVNDVVWGGGRWVAVGRGNSIADGSGVSILYSVDTGADYAVSGRRWVGVAASAQLFPYGTSSIAWNGKRFIATGPAAASCSTGNIIAWSADGISWTGYSTAKTVAPGQRWIAVGSGSRACIALSTDGRVWTDVAGTSAIFSDFNNATTTLVNTMKTGARAVGWNGSTLIVGGSRSTTTTTPSSQEIATSSIGRTTIPVCAFIGSGNGLMGGGTTNTWDASLNGAYTRVSSSVFITHMDVNIREASAPWANMWLNTYTDLSATRLFQVTPEMHTFSSALKWNGWSWVANFGMTTNNPVTREQYGSIWFCTDPLARIGWSVASNSTNPRILIGQGGYAALEWNGVAWLACGYDPNNNNLIYTTDKYGAIGWTAVSGIVSGPGSASFQPVCIASSSRYWVVGGSQGTTSAMYFTSDRTGATGWRAIAASGGSALPGIRISSVAYNGTAWICCGGGGGGSGSPASTISWRADTGSNEDIGTGWATATNSATSGGIPPVLSNCSAITYNSGANSPIWVVVGDVTSNTANQVAYTTTANGSNEWKLATGIFTNTTFGRLTGIAWTGYSWIATSAAGSGRILSTMNINCSSGWNTSPTQSIYSPTLCTNAVTYVNIPISLLTTGMPTSAGAGAGTGAMWRAGVGRAQGLLQGGGTDTTAVVMRSSNGAEGTSWSQTYSRNFLIAVGGGAIRDASNGGGTNRMAYSYDGGLSWTTNNTSVLTNAATNSIGTIRTVKYGNRIWVAGGDASGSSVSGNNCLAWSRDGVNWSGAGGTQIFGSAGSCYAVCCNDRGRWVAVGGSPLTTAGTYTNTSGSIYTMAWSDDGQNWMPILGSRALFSIVCQGVSYGADASGVGMWTAIGRGSAYTGCAYSYDAKTWFLSQTSGSLFGTTVNVLTERYAPVASASWLRVCMSSSGQYQTALVNLGNIWTSFDYGVTWTARTAPGNLIWTSVSLSSTGQYQAAAVTGGGIWFSSDYGVTWVLKTSLNTDWRVVALSSTGQYVTAVSSNSTIWVSSNYGDSFGGRSINAAWYSLGMSSTGQYQTAAISGTANYISSDYGETWTITNPTTQQWRGTSLSSTGQYQTSVVTSGNIWRSTNYGQTWASTAIMLTWIGISLSSTGQYQTACAENPSGVIYTSSDYGETWSNRTISGVTNYLGVSISSTGQYQTVVVSGGLIYISSNFGETWSASANDSRSLSVAYGKDANGAGMWVATAGRRDRDISPNIANTMAYSYDGKLWRGITAAAGLSEQAWSVAYGKDGFGVGMWVAAGYDTTCGLKWSYDGVTWNAPTGASGAAVWTGAAAGRRALCVYWNGSMWLASTSDTRNGEPRGTLIAANNASSVPGYFLYSYNGKNWLPVLAPNTYDATISASAQASVYSVLPNPAILDFGSFYDDQSQRGNTIANTRAGKTIGAVMSGGLPIKNINTIVPYGKGSLTTGQVPFLLGGDSGLQEGTVSETTQRFANYNIISSSNAYDSFIPGPTAQSTNNQWQYFDVNQNRSVAALLSQWDTGGNPIILTFGQWDNNIGDFNDYPFIQKVTTTGTVNGVGASFTGPALILHPAETNTNNIGLGYKNITTDTINVIIDIKVSLLLPALNTGDGIEYYIQRQLVGNPRYRIYTNSIIPQRSTAIHSCNDTIELQSGEFIYLIVNRRAAYGYDHTRVEFTVNIVNTISALVATLVRELYYNNPITSELASATASLSTSTDGGITWRAVPNSTNVMTKVNKIQSDESTQQIVAVGTGNYSVATSTPAKAADADGWVGVFGSRMTDTRAGLFEKYGTGASWFGGAKMWIASGRAQSRRGSSLAVSVNGTVWQDAKIVSQVAAGTSGAGRGGGLLNRTTNTITTSVAGMNNEGLSSTFSIISTPGGVVPYTNLAMTNTVVPYTSAATPLLTYTDSAAAFSTQVNAVAVNSQYNRVVVGGSSVQFVAGGSGGSLAYSDDGEKWENVTNPSLSTPTNATTRTGSGGFDASFGTVALTQRLTPQTAYATGDYNGVAVNETGQYQTAGVYGGLIYTSSNYGVNWTSRIDSTNRNWNRIGMSSSGQYQTAVVATSLLYTSSDFGVTWTGRVTANWSSVSVSSTGQYQTAVVDNGLIWTSADYGVNWLVGAVARLWNSVSVSSTGQYQTAVVRGTGGQIWVSSDYGFSWSARGGATGYSAISMSSTGQYQTVAVENGNLFTSNDFGTSWTSRAISASWCFCGLSVSSTGQYQTACVFSTTSNGYIFTSSDFGVTWTSRVNDANRNWRSCSISGSGQYQSASVDVVYSSSDFGNTWVRRSTATRTNTFTRVRSSASGQYQVATSGPVGNTNGQFYVSSDYGQSWIPRRGLGTWLGGAVSATGAIMTTFSTPTAATAAILRSIDYGTTFSDISGVTLTGSAYWRAISATNSADIQTAVAFSGAIYRSSDYGASWSNAGITIDGSANANTITPRNWHDIAISSETGAVQVTCVSGGYLYVSTNTGASWWASPSINIDLVPQATNRSWQAVAVSANGQYGLACVNNGYLYISSTNGASWTSTVNIDGVTPQATNRAWQDVGMSANGKYQVACVGTSGLIYYSKSYGANWTSLTAAGTRAWSSVALSENGSTISATTNDISGGVWVYSMPDDQYYQPSTLTNSGSTTTATVRAIAYGNSGVGAAVDGYWVVGADASANSLAYSSNGIDWTAVIGSKTTLFNAVNGVAYGSDGMGTPMWIAVGQPFVGSVSGTTAYSIAYSYNMTTWVGVRNNANFTGQGNHVTYGEDEFGIGMWVAVGQADGALAANLGDSSFYNSNGNTNTTIFYSYDGANWAAAAGAGVFAVSGTDVTWGVDASGVATWVATGIGYTNPLTGAVITGGQVAYSTNGRVWLPIRAPVSSGLSATTLPATSRAHSMLPPPPSAGFVTPTYNNIWRLLGGDINGEAQGDESGQSVSISADGTIVAIGARLNDGNGNSSGHVRVYKYNPNKTSADVLGPASWDKLGGDIDGEAAADESGGWSWNPNSIKLSADGTVIAIGANLNDGNGADSGHVRVYKYTPSKTVAVTNQADASFGPVGWNRLGGDIDGEATNDYSGCSIDLSSDGTVVVIGAWGNDGNVTNSGHARVYKYDPTKTNANGSGPVGWDRLGGDIDGEALEDRSGQSVSISSDGTTVAIGSHQNDGNGADSGHVRVYKYTPSKTVAVTTQADASFGPIGWNRLGGDIDGEAANDQSGTTIRLSADGTIVAIGAVNNDGNGADSGHVRVYKYTPSKTVAVTNQADASFGPIGWKRLGGDIDGEAVNDNSGFSIALSADGTIVAIGGKLNDGPIGTDRGHVRVYKYNPNKSSAITNQSLPNFGPVGWNRIGVDIDGEDSPYQSGTSVGISADGTTLAIGSSKAPGAGTTSGDVRVYKLDTFGAITYTSSNPAVAEIYGNALLIIKDISAGTTTITATQAAVPPFTMEQAVIQGTLTVTASTTFSLQYTTISSVFTPFPGMVMGDILNVAYGRAGTNGTGAPRWLVGGSGGTNVFARSSRPSDITTPSGVWTVNASNAVGIPFPICNSVAYSNGVWVAGNNTSATNIIARSTDGGETWNSITTSSVIGILTGAAAIGANSFCNFSLAVADYSNDTNLRSWIAVQGTKNFMFDGGVNTVTTPTPNILASAYNGTSRAWWVAGGRNQNTGGVGGRASIAYTIDPSGATGWTLGTSNIANSGNGIIDLEQINAIKFSPHTQNWIAVGVGSAATPTRTALYSTNGISWTSTVVSSTDASLNLNTCAWNQLDASASSAGRWLAGGTRSGTDASAVSLYISTDVSGNTWTPIVGTGAILSQVYSLAFNGAVWIAAGTPATSNGSTSTLMRTTDPSGATGWQGIAATNVSTGGFDTAARSVTWNAEQQMWIATGENTGFSADASFSSVIFSRDATGAAGTWRSVRESNSFCFSGEGMGVTFKGDRWFASGQGTNQIVATTGSTAANASTATWTPITHGSSMTSISDIAYTGRRLIATGSSAGGTNNGIIYTTDNSGSTWNNIPTITINTLQLNGTALQFNGTTNFIDFSANITELGKASFTIECWVKTTGTSMGLLNCQDSDSTWESGEKSLYIDSVGRPVFAGYGNNYIYSTTVVNDNAWHHLAMTWSYSSGTSGTGTFYIDGINQTGTNYSLYPQYAANNNNTGTFVFGKPNYFENINFFNGAVCELRIWNVARSATEIFQNYSRMLVGNETGLVAYNRFNQGIADGTNTNITTVTNNKTTGGFTATLSGNFTLIGTSPNWVSGLFDSGTSMSVSGLFDSGTSITIEPSIEGGAGHVVATGRSAATSLSISTDGGVSWSSPSVQLSALGGSSSATTQPLFTTGGNSVAYVGNDTLFAGGANDVEWTGKRWVATGRNIAPTTATPIPTSTSTPLIDVINNNTSAVATSDDGITWQSVSSSQAPNLSDGTVIASNSRIGPTPLINSQIVISDGGDTEPTADYGGMTCGMGGSGTGIAQIDIIAELPPVSNAASGGAVNNLGVAGNGGANSIGNAPNASFDTTAFAITTRQI